MAIIISRIFVYFAVIIPYMKHPVRLRHVRWVCFVFAWFCGGLSEKIFPVTVLVTAHSNHVFRVFVD